MTLVVTGPPQRLTPPLMGYPWMLPTNEAPDTELGNRIEANDWGALVDPRLARRGVIVRDGRVLLPGMDLRDLLPLLDDIVSEIERLAADQASRRSAEDAERLRQTEVEAERAARDEALARQWWEERGQRR